MLQPPAPDRRLIGGEQTIRTAERRRRESEGAMNTNFVRSNSDKMIAGVCGGIARYFGIDSTIVRLVFVLAVLSGVTPLLYVILWIIMPSEPTAAPAAPAPTQPVAALPGQPRPVEDWKYDPYTGERLSS
jgi:phage shock protein C